MRLDFASQATAQALADAIHARMIASFPAYARSVASGQTQRWAIPYQDDGVGNWWVNLKERVDPVLTTQERAALKPFASAEAKAR